ncbi:hypothetical protein RND81_12G188100 [Saponaria officinalis]|uniref:25S rRNA (uridine-N(3))-methyltransferase BMT5-like domain-containing protein n=1 Tax=Saponaria officinalis TaxID=3572 RepID=A0AAW1HCJ0_SAPOF
MGQTLSNIRQILESQETITQETVSYIQQLLESQETTQEIVNKEVNTEVLVTPHFKLTRVPRETVKKIGPYTSKQKILLVGEGDFSFSASLAIAFGCASNMIATSLNPQEFLEKHYSMFPQNKMALEVRGGTVLHGVDATNMIGSVRFDRIIFNFPHAGCFGRTHHDIRINRGLIKGFLRCAKKMLKRQGEIHITHKSNGFFRQWNMPKLGMDEGLHLIQEIEFIRSTYGGYHTKFGFGGDKDFDCNPSKTYMFGIHPA